MNKDKIKSFWNENHPNSKHSDVLQELVPSNGECENKFAEKFRCGVRVYYDYYNNGLGNMWDGEYLWDCLNTAYSYVKNHSNKIVKNSIDYVYERIETLYEEHQEWDGNSWYDCDCEEYEEYGECSCSGFEPTYDIEDIVDKNKFQLGLNILIDAIVVKATKENFGKDIELDNNNLVLYSDNFMEDKKAEDKSDCLTNVKVKLTGADGNAFAIIGAVSSALKRGGHRDLSEKYREEAMSGDYNNVIITSMKYAEIS